MLDNLPILDNNYLSALARFLNPGTPGDAGTSLIVDGMESRNVGMTAVNSAIEVDLTGQVCSDSIGERIHSGFGGQADFFFLFVVTSVAAGILIFALSPLLLKLQRTRHD